MLDTSILISKSLGYFGVLMGDFVVRPAPLPQREAMVLNESA